MKPSRFPSLEEFLGEHHAETAAEAEARRVADAQRERDAIAAAQLPSYPRKKNGKSSTARHANGDSSPTHGTAFAFVGDVQFAKLLVLQAQDPEIPAERTLAAVEALAADIAAQKADDTRTKEAVEKILKRPRPRMDEAEEKYVIVGDRPAQRERKRDREITNRRVARAQTADRVSIAKVEKQLTQAMRILERRLDEEAGRQLG